MMNAKALKQMVKEICSWLLPVRIDIRRPPTHPTKVTTKNLFPVPFSGT